MEALDYLKSNCRSWEYDCDNADDTYRLASHLHNKFPNIPFAELYQMAVDWTGYDNKN